MGSINVCLERKERGGCGVKGLLGICLVEAASISTGIVELFLVGKLLWLDKLIWQIDLI